MTVTTVIRETMLLYWILKPKNSLLLLSNWQPSARMRSNILTLGTPVPPGTGIKRNFPQACDGSGRRLQM